MNNSEFFDPAFDLSTLPAYPDLPARKRNIWLASYPKSGNTWMRLFLAAYLQDKDTADINDDLEQNHQCNRAVFARLIAQKPISEFTKLDITRVRTGIQRLYARSDSNFFIKTHCAIATQNGHPTFDPASTSASIVILRNPLAVLPSFARHMGVEIDIAVRQMAKPDLMLGNLHDNVLPIFQSGWSEFTRSWIGAQKFMNCTFVKYEDMKDDPVKAFSQVLGHVRVPVDQDRIRRAVGATDFDKLKAQDISQGFKERTNIDKGNIFFRSGKVDGWRKELNEEHIIGTFRNHWDLMEQLGYVPSDMTGEFEGVKYQALEELAAKNIDLGVYAKELNELREKRGVKTRLKIRSGKAAVSHRQVRRNTSRPEGKKTFG